MEKHVQLVAILMIVYRSLLILASVFIFALTAWITHIIEFQVFRHGDVPVEFLNIVPMILLAVSTVLFVVSVIGIIGAIGLLQRKEWGRVITLMVSCLNLIHVPLGTALGIYSLWVLMSDETVKLFNPTAGGQLAPQ